jgi:hypothetical protein
MDRGAPWTCKRASQAVETDDRIYPTALYMSDAQIMQLWLVPAPEGPVLALVPGAIGASVLFRALSTVA